MASIQVIQGPEKGRNFELTEGENILGRQSTTVQLTDGTLSRRHSRLILQNGQWMLEDLGSANGLFVNGDRVKEHDLIHGDRIKIGKTVLAFKEN